MLTKEELLHKFVDKGEIKSKMMTVASQMIVDHEKEKDNSIQIITE